MDPAPAFRAAVANHASTLLRELSGCPRPALPVRVTEDANGLACTIVVWPADGRVPREPGNTRTRESGGRERCRADILAVVQSAGRPMTRKEVFRALKQNIEGHGAGTVAKALADLTRSGELINYKDKRGYRLPRWQRCRPGLFDKV